MSHKEQCKLHCKNYLQDMRLNQYFNDAQFEHVYRKQQGATANAWSVGINAADYIIQNSKFISNDTGNETEA